MGQCRVGQIGIDYQGNPPSYCAIATMVVIQELSGAIT